MYIPEVLEMFCGQPNPRSPQNCEKKLQIVAAELGAKV